MDGDAHMESHMDGAHMDGDASRMQTGTWTAITIRRPRGSPCRDGGAEEQLPVTDMSLEVDGDHHGEPGVPAGGVASQRRRPPRRPRRCPLRNRLRPSLLRRRVE